MGRWIRFMLAIMIGIAAGLFIGWVITPKHPQSIPPNTLRQDYQTDYVLMVAEIYHQQQDPIRARQQLANLNAQPPVQLVQQAIQFGQSVGYAENDLNLMRALAGAFTNSAVSAGTPTP
jgi:hypothetical protein